jgi:hypothetical protein
VPALLSRCKTGGAGEAGMVLTRFSILLKIGLTLVATCFSPEKSLR